MRIARRCSGYTVSNVGNAALFSAPPAVASNGTLTYTPAADAFGTSTFQVVVQDDGSTANGGVDTSAAQSVHHHRDRGERRAQLYAARQSRGGK